MNWNGLLWPASPRTSRKTRLKSAQHLAQALSTDFFFSAQGRHVNSTWDKTGGCGPGAARMRRVPTPGRGSVPVAEGERPGPTRSRTAGRPSGGGDRCTHAWLHATCWAFMGNLPTLFQKPLRRDRDFCSLGPQGASRKEELKAELLGVKSIFRAEKRQEK